MSDFLSGKMTSQDMIAVAIILVVTVVLGASFFFLFHQNQLKAIDAINEENDAEVAKLERARRIRDEIEGLERDTRQIEGLVKEFEDRLPTTREIATLIREFELMADDEDILLGELSSLPVTIDARKETIPYRVVAHGSFHQIASFINRLERFKRYLKITNLSIDPQVKGIATARFTLNTFRFSPEIEGPPSES